MFGKIEQLVIYENVVLIQYVPVVVATIETQVTERTSIYISIPLMLRWFITFYRIHLHKEKLDWILQNSITCGRGCGCCYRCCCGCCYRCCRRSCRNILFTDEPDKRIGIRQPITREILPEQVVVSWVPHTISITIRLVISPRREARSIEKQKSSPAWPQEAYRLCPPLGHDCWNCLPNFFCWNFFLKLFAPRPRSRLPWPSPGPWIRGAPPLVLDIWWQNLELQGTGPLTWSWTSGGNIWNYSGWAPPTVDRHTK